MRYLLLFLLAYLIYRYMKPLLQKKPENPHVKGGDRKKSINSDKSRNIEDADFEEIE